MQYTCGPNNKVVEVIFFPIFVNSKLKGYNFICQSVMLCVCYWGSYVNHFSPVMCSFVAAIFIHPYSHTYMHTYIHSYLHTYTHMCRHRPALLMEAVVYFITGLWIWPSCVWFTDVECVWKLFLPTLHFIALYKYLCSWANHVHNCWCVTALFH